MPELIAEPRFSDAAPELAGHLDRVRARQGLVALRTALASALVVMLAWLAVEMSLDWLVELPLWARAAFLAAGLGGAAFALWHFGVREWLNRPDDERIALAIERALPQFRSRFIASVQLSRQKDGAGSSLVKALLRETTEVAAETPFIEVVNTDRLRRSTRIVAVALFLAGVLCWIGGPASWPLFQRAWLARVPVPRKTMITAFTGDRVIAVGDDLRIEAKAAGIIPKVGKLVIETAAGKSQEFTLDPVAAMTEPAHFFRTLQSIQENFRYRIELGDNRTKSASVRVRPRPSVASLACEQIWPAYTGLPPIRRSPGSLKLLAGSKLAVQLKPTSPLRAATLRLVGTDPATNVRSAALATDPRDEWSGEVEIPKKDVSGMTFQLTDEEGVESGAMAIHRIEIVPDQPPTIRVLLPARREELVTPKATLLLAFEAKDDFGIANVLLHYAVNWTEGAPHKTLELDLGSDKLKTMTRRFEWKLERLTPPLNEGDVIDFWLEARDANNITGPGITTLPEHYQARVVSEADKRADLANRLNDTLQGLNDVRQGQEDLAERLGDLIREKPARP